MRDLVASGLAIICILLLVAVVILALATFHGLVRRDHPRGDAQMQLNATFDPDAYVAGKTCDCHEPARPAVATLTLTDLDILIYLCEETAEATAEEAEAQKQTPRRNQQQEEKER